MFSLITLLYYMFLFFEKVQEVRGQVNTASHNQTVGTVPAPAKTIRNDINTQIECGTKQIIIRPGVYSMFDVEIKTYRIGDCFFDALSFDEIVILSNNWIFDCGFRQVNMTTSPNVDKLTNDEWNLRYISFETELEFSSTVKGDVIFANDFQAKSWTQKIYCHFKQLYHTEITYNFPACFDYENQSCKIPDDKLSPHNCTVTMPDCDVPPDCSTDNLTGNEICYNKCTCKPNEVILEPVGGGGNFDLRQGLFLDEHLKTELLPGVDFRPGIDQLFIGFELIGVTNPNMVVIIENLWATSSPDKNAPNPLMLIEKGNDCAKVHPLMGDMPRPNPYEEGDGEHPHLAFQVDHTIFQMMENPFMHIQTMSGMSDDSSDADNLDILWILKAGINPVFIHYQTKVCVDGPSENCFPEKCPDDARQLIDTEHMLSDFIQGGHMDDSGQIIPNNIAKIVFDPLQDPDREKKQTWNQIIADNFDKIESAKKRPVKYEKDAKANEVTHNRIYSNSESKNDNVIFSSRHSHQNQRSSRSTLSTISHQRFEQVYTIGPFNLLHHKMNSNPDYQQANIQLIHFPTGLDQFVMSGPGYFTIIVILSIDIFLSINLLRHFN